MARKKASSFRLRQEQDQKRRFNSISEIREYITSNTPAPFRVLSSVLFRLRMLYPTRFSNDQHQQTPQTGGPPLPLSFSGNPFH